MKTGRVEAGEVARTSVTTSGVNKGVAVLDFILRIVAFVCTLKSTIAMGTTDETLRFFIQYIRFHAKYDDLSTFTLIDVANSVVTAYLILSLPISIFHIMSVAQNMKIVLVIMDTVMLALLTAGASASVAIVYLARKGNTKANWFSISQQFNSFCGHISGSLIKSFGGVVFFVLLIMLSAVAQSRC